ncbi:WD40 repeat-like protein [Piedraia hortae CBS 480.64]|uniref:WD40 repeat-like protein n=1 Tax=Piedraia hortae CBS 480.64 TaxID=1314780 RepID=A0A6A7C1J8_9PEZI|nr:WD40 repeat-like protein [Piedraia hortae CBS 480.64]
MAAEIQPVPTVRLPPGPAPLTADQVYWKSFKRPLLLPSLHNAGVTAITTPAYNPAGPQSDTFAVTSGGRVQIHSSKTRKLIKTISRFGVDDTARSGVIRRDGRIMLAGGDGGIMQAFDTGSRAILRQWKGGSGPKQAVHCVRWNPKVLTEFISTSDDRTVKLWDLTGDEPSWVGLGHEDYVRRACFVPGTDGLVATGSYDQTVRLWDTRRRGDGEDSAVLTFKCAAPIEDVLALNGTTLAAAGGEEVVILDMANGKTQAILRSHQKTVTCLALAQNGTRLLTGALDGHVKVHSIGTWKVVAGIKYQAPILTLAVIQSGPRENGREDKHIAVGLQSGLLSVRTRLAGSEKAQEREKTKKMNALLAGEADEYERRKRKKDLRQGIRARDRGKDFRGEGADLIITGQDMTKRKKLRPWQSNLRKGKYGLALDQVMAERQTNEIMTLITALQHRSALRAALSERSEEQVLPLLSWAVRYVRDPRYLQLVHDATSVILELYSAKMVEWPSARALVERLTRRVHNEVDLAQQAVSTMGVLELLEAG